MPRLPRAIAVGYPHHITQRGNHREAVFTEPGDYSRYLNWLAQYAEKYSFDVWAYCLMPNHVHLVGVPGNDGSLARTFNTVHMKYAQHHNRKSGKTGHLWQGRFFSCVLDERYVYAAIRYVEMNPVRSGLCGCPEDYLWSSARLHIAGIRTSPLSGRCYLTDTVRDWREYLSSERSDRASRDAVVKATKSGHPCGSEDFVRRIEGILGRRFATRPRGRPRKKNGTEESL
ncbi:MAG: transposase [Syntrophus sp. (in: bacteria)]|nr:transposase [Syntrophus sp. (in: bacteria)]